MPTLANLFGAVWFLLPAGAANMAPVFAKHLLPSWNAPVDFHCMVRGRRLFGNHKTWRGMIAGVVSAAVVFSIQQFLFASFAELRDLSAFDCAGHSMLLGAWMGLGALAGDLIKSAAKRQLNIRPGHSWIPFDKADWLVGAVAFTWPAVALSPGLVVNVFVVGLALHVVVNIAGHLLRLKPRWL